MKNFFLVIFVSCLSTAYGFQKNIPIQYRISSVEIDSIPMLKIQATFQANTKGMTDLHYNNNTWGNRNLFDCLVAPRITNEKAKVFVERDSNRIRIKHAPELKTLEFEYFLKQDTKGDLSIDNYYRPIIQKDYFHVFSLELFIVPEVEVETLFDITLSWENFPKNYIVHNSYGPVGKVQKLKNETLDSFLQAICIGGDYRIYPLTARDYNASFVTRGQYKTLDEVDIRVVLDKIITGLDQFWRKEDNDFLTVILSTVKVDFKGSTHGGTGLSSSFDAFCSDNEYTSILQLVSLFCHELNHLWIGQTIENSNEEEQYWFSEGFTTYYAAKLIAKKKIYKVDGSFFIHEMNNIIKQHYSSPVKNAPNKAITTKTFWGDRNYEQIPYNRGAIFAFYLDLKIQKESNKKFGLDDVMRTILKDAKASGQKLTHAYFVQTVNHFLKEDISSDFKRFIEDGEALRLEDFFEAHNLIYDSSFSEFAPLGLRYGGAENKQIISVMENSDAEEAGFKVGDILVASEKKPKLGQKAFYTVKRGDKIIEISLIRKGEVINIPQLKNTEQNLQLLGF